MARIVVTGGGGFIGAHATRYLLDAGHEVTVLDYFHQYLHPVQPTFLENTNWRLTQLLKGAEVRYTSTIHKDDLRRHLIELRPNYVLHLAGLPLANVAIRQTEEAFESILVGTVNLLEILRDLGNLEKIVYVSSSLVYGDFTEVPMPEDGAKRPKEIYGGMKLAGEISVQVFSQRYDLPHAIVRPSAVYGPGDNNRRVIQIFVENAVAGLPIVAKDPDQTWLDFTYVSDIAAGMAEVLLSPTAANEAFNITRGEGHTLGEVIDILRPLFPELEVDVMVNDETFRPKRGALDVSKAARLVGWKPSVSLLEGMMRYVEWVQSTNRSLVEH